MIRELQNEKFAAKELISEKIDAFKLPSDNSELVAFKKKAEELVAELPSAKGIKPLLKFTSELESDNFKKFDSFFKDSN